MSAFVNSLQICLASTPCIRMLMQRMYCTLCTRAVLPPQYNFEVGGVLLTLTLCCCRVFIWLADVDQKACARHSFAVLVSKQSLYYVCTTAASVYACAGDAAEPMEDVQQPGGLALPAGASIARLQKGCECLHVFNTVHKKCERVAQSLVCHVAAVRRLCRRHTLAGQAH